MIERRISLDMDELIVAAARNPERTFAAHLLSWCRNFGQRAKLMSSDDQRSGDQTQPVQLGRAPASRRAISSGVRRTASFKAASACLACPWIAWSVPTQGAAPPRPPSSGLRPEERRVGTGGAGRGRYGGA